MEKMRIEVKEEILTVLLLTLPNFFIFILDLVFIYATGSFDGIDMLIMLIIVIFTSLNLLREADNKITQRMAYIGASSGFVMFIIIIILANI